MTTTPNLIQRIKEARLRATQGNWEVKICRDGLHAGKPCLAVCDNIELFGFRQLYREHRNENDIAFSVIAANEGHKLIEALEIARKALKRDCWCPGEKDWETGKEILCESCEALKDIEEILK